MGTTVIASPRQTDVPLSLLVTRDGGITGLTVVCRIQDPVSGNFVDFADGVFKAAGHTTLDRTLPPEDAVNAPGQYGVLEDFSAFTIPGGTTTLKAYYEITAGGETGNDVDIIMLNPIGVEDAVLDALQTDHVAINTVGGSLLGAAAQGLRYTLEDNIVYGGPPGQPTSLRRRQFSNLAARLAATPGAADNADGEIARWTMTAVYSGVTATDTLTSMASDRTL